MMTPFLSPILVGSLLVLAACTPTAPEPPAVTADASANATDAQDYIASLRQWRTEREERLRDPEGWMSFAGSGTLHPGRFSVGSGGDNAIVLARGPAQWGTLALGEDGSLRFDAAPDSGVTVEGKVFTSLPLLTQLDDAGPTTIHVGPLRFYVVKTGDIFGWRYRDPESPSLQAFDGVPVFDISPSWRIEADWEAFASPRAIQLLTTNGTLDAATVPGQAHFERDGKRFTLLPVQQKPDDDLFFIIADRTSGGSTYGGGRFLYAKPAQDGKVELDFNKAVNPPCALNGHVVCPTAPPENRMDVHIEAGEKTYVAVK